jgi:hypothetical protein
VRSASDIVSLYQPESHLAIDDSNLYFRPPDASNSVLPATGCFKFCTSGHRMLQILHFWPIDDSNAGATVLARIGSKGFKDHIRPIDASKSGQSMLQVTVGESVNK